MEWIISQATLIRPLAITLSYRKRIVRLAVSNLSALMDSGNSEKRISSISIRISQDSMLFLKAVVFGIARSLQGIFSGINRLVEFPLRMLATSQLRINLCGIVYLWGVGLG